MKLRALKLVCFSPTGTTHAIVRAVARGIDQGAVELLDITTPEARRQPLRTSADELLIVGVPVYMGRVPALLSDWLHAIEAHNTPAVAIVVYGNRAYENALLELTDVLTRRGCVPIASAAYIGEHSFSSPDTPTAEGRPDARDLSHAAQFGREIAAKLRSASSVERASAVEVPGSYPYGGITELWSVDFIAVSDDCNQCGTCAAVCPVGAIDPERSDRIDVDKCVTCCACIKACPQGARTMKAGPVKDAAMRLNTLHGARKEPSVFV
jgi:ferredoxin